MCTKKFSFFFFFRYFQCKQNHGIFAPIEKIKLSNQSDQYQFKPIKSEDILNDYKMIDNNSESLLNTDLNMSSNSNTSSLSRLSFQLKVNRFNNNNKIDQSPTTIPTVTTTHSSASKLVGVFKPICTNSASDTNMSQAQSGIIIMIILITIIEHTLKNAKTKICSFKVIIIKKEKK